MEEPNIRKSRKFSKEEKHRILTDPNSAQVKYRPVLQEDVPPTPDPQSEYYLIHLAWWAEQIRRCMEGWVCPVDGHYINPIYYFYLNFVKIYFIDELGSGRAKWGAPYYRRSDEEIFDRFWYCMPKTVKGEMVNSTNLFASKARRKAWSTAELYGLTTYLFLFFPDYDLNRAYPDNRTQRKERRRFVSCYNRIHDYFKYNAQGRRMSIVIDNQEEVAQGVTTSGGKSSPQNTVYFYTVSKDSGAVRGDLLLCVFIIEAGKWSGNLKSFIMSSEETLALGVLKFGFVVMGGTSDSINNTDTDYRDLCYNPSFYKAVDIFIPAYRAYLGFIDYYNGFDDTEDALWHLYARRKLLEESGDAEALAMFVQENPFIKEEAFIPSVNNEYPKEKIDQQFMRILRENLMQHWVRGEFEFEKDFMGKDLDTVAFVPSLSGKWEVLTEALIPLEYEGLHKAGSDSYFKDQVKEKRKSSSKGCMIIWRKPTAHPVASDMPVAIYLGRPNTRVDMFWAWLKGLIYFEATDLHEHITPDWQNFLVEQGHGHRYQLLSNGDGADPRGRFGDITVLGLNFFRQDRHLKISHLGIIDSFRFWNLKENSDEASTMGQVLWHLDLVKDAPVKESKEEPRGQMLTLGMRESFADFEDTLSLGVRGFG